MRAATIVGIVGDEHVAWLDRVLGKALLKAFDGADHRAQMNRNMLGLGYDFAFGVEDGGRKVVPLLDIR